MASAAAAGPAVPYAQWLERLFRELAPYVLRVLPRLGVREADLDDMLQEVFLAVHRGLPSFEGRSSEKTWVYGICLRACSNYRQRAFRRREQMIEAVPEQADTRTPERATAASRALRRLDAVLGELPAAQREVFVLFEIEDLSVLEIAEATGCSKFTVYTRLHKARRTVQAAMRAAEQEEGAHA